MTAVSGSTELVGAALIALGLLARLAAIPRCFNMLVAIATVNIKGSAASTTSSS